MLRSIILIALVTIICGCQTPTKRGDIISSRSNIAYVIVALDGDMRLDDGRYCKIICTAWYSFGSESTRGVHIFPIEVGKAFEINTLISGMHAVSFKGKRIEIKRAGVYYFGKIQSISMKLYYAPEPDPAILREAIRKYGIELSNLNSVDFEWPIN